MRELINFVFGIVSLYLLPFVGLLMLLQVSSPLWDNLTWWQFLLIELGALIVYGASEEDRRPIWERNSRKST